MTHEEIIALAKEAGLPYLPTPNSALVRIVKKAVLIEREACAKVCEQTGEDGEGPDCWGWHAKDYARAIRQRGAA